jgi:glycine betaine/choline ABC-type transport system substrate-binding protein
MRRNLLVVPLVLCTAALAACGGSDNDNNGGGSTSAGGTKLTAIQKNSANSGKTITVGSKNFTEEFILGNIYAQALKAAGYNVKTQFNLGSEQIANRALKQGQVDAYPEYTSTALTSFFHVKIADTPKNAAKAYAQARTEYAKEGLTALPPTPFNDAQAVGMTKKEANSLGVKTISDMKPKEKSIVFAGTPECKQRVDCLLGLQQVYGLKFKKFTPVDIDDKHIFPPYNATFVIRNAALKKLGPDVRKVIVQVQKGMTTRVMQELNSRVDIDKQEPKDVAAQYLKETGLVQ